MKIAVLSDTHGLLRRAVVGQLGDCPYILHAGDVIRESDLDELGLHGRIYAVRGNCDRWSFGLENLCATLRFRIEGVSFYMTHDPADVPRDLTGIDAVVCGHTHCYREAWTDGRLWLNPGSCGRARPGLAVTMAKLTVENGKITGVERIEFDDAEP